MTVDGSAPSQLVHINMEVMLVSVMAVACKATEHSGGPTVRVEYARGGWVKLLENKSLEANYCGLTQRSKVSNIGMWTEVGKEHVTNSICME